MDEEIRRRAEADETTAAQALDPTTFRRRSTIQIVPPRRSSLFGGFAKRQSETRTALLSHPVSARNTTDTAPEPVTASDAPAGDAGADVRPVRTSLARVSISADAGAVPDAAADVAPAAVKRPKRATTYHVNVNARGGNASKLPR
jgi:hypothetical protein